MGDEHADLSSRGSVASAAARGWQRVDHSSRQEAQLQQLGSAASEPWLEGSGAGARAQGASLGGRAAGTRARGDGGSAVA